jgi:hypothetical protein
MAPAEMPGRGAGRLDSLPAASDAGPDSRPELAAASTDLAGSRHEQHPFTGALWLNESHSPWGVTSWLFQRGRLNLPQALVSDPQDLADFLQDPVLPESAGGRSGRSVAAEASTSARSRRPVGARASFARRAGGRSGRSVTAEASTSARSRRPMGARAWHADESLAAVGRRTRPAMCSSRQR